MSEVIHVYKDQPPIPAKKLTFGHMVFFLALVVFIFSPTVLLYYLVSVPEVVWIYLVACGIPSVWAAGIAMIVWGKISAARVLPRVETKIEYVKIDPDQLQGAISAKQIEASNGDLEVADVSDDEVETQEKILQGFNYASHEMSLHDYDYHGTVKVEGNAYEGFTFELEIYDGESGHSKTYPYPLKEVCTSERLALKAAIPYFISKFLQDDPRVSSTDFKLTHHLFEKNTPYPWINLIKFSEDFSTIETLKSYLPEPATEDIFPLEGFAVKVSCCSLNLETHLDKAERFSLEYQAMVEMRSQKVLYAFDTGPKVFYV